MDVKSRRRKRQDNTLSLLNAAIDATNLAKEVMSGTPAKAIFGSVGIILTTIRVSFLPFSDVLSGFTPNQDSMANKSDYVELGLACANVCQALERGMNGKKLRDLSQSACEAMNLLTALVEVVMLSLGGSLTTLLITELWQRSGRRSSSRADGTQPFDLSTRGTIRI